VICPENSDLTGLYVMGGRANTCRQTSGRYLLTQTRDGRWTINDTSILYARTSLPLGLPTEAARWSCFMHNAYVEAPGTQITALQEPKLGSSASSIYKLSSYSLSSVRFLSCTVGSCAVTCPQNSALNGIYVPQDLQQKSYLLEGGPYALEQDKHGIWNITDGKVHHARAEYPTKSPAQAMSWVLLTTVDDARHEAARAPGMRVTDLTASKPSKEDEVSWLHCVCRSHETYLCTRAMVPTELAAGTPGGTHRAAHGRVGTTTCCKYFSNQNCIVSVLRCEVCAPARLKR
jgi:hypothetical protein